MRGRRELRGSILVIASATCFGLMPIFAIYAYQNGLNVTTLLFLRFGIAALLFFFYLVIKGELRKLTYRETLNLLLLGGGLYTGQSFLYFSAVQYLTPALAALLLYLYPLFVYILSVLLKEEKVTLRSLIAMGIALIGITLVLGYPNLGPINMKGVYLAVGAALLYSIYIISGNRLSLKLSPIVTSSYISLFAAVSFLSIILVQEEFRLPLTWVGWISVWGVAIFSTVIAILTFFAGTNWIGPTKASIISMIEPVVTILFAWILFKEHMTFIQILGAFIVLLGGVIITTEIPIHFKIKELLRRVQK
ncbi:DMT family transporter [Hazenella sp. IB182357]|uniref:DMT family transporter n=1 Tax=Polycladospora coralii TaxID=2771432 RepID=A0A926RUK4_9BACL|nr:DMT family transporter [Polycladospora coralii]MBD1372677.1 DMT family transporter [Polycladospora coralii]